MKLSRSSTLLVLLIGLWLNLTPAWGVSKEIIQLQTQVQALQDQMTHRQAQPLGQGQRLALVAGGGIGNHPALAMQLQHDGGRFGIVSLTNTVRSPGRRLLACIHLLHSQIQAPLSARQCSRGYP